MSTETWELPTSSAAIFPKVESDRLENEENYYVWSVRMRNAFESCEMMGVVDGSETCPPDDTPISRRIVYGRRRIVSQKP